MTVSLSLAQVSDVQNQDEASLVHAMDLASGKPVRKIMVKTLAESFTWEALDYIGAIGADEEAEELRGFHSSLLLAHLGYLNEVHQYHKSFPWKIILGTQPCYLEELMMEMESMWSFITDNIDTLSPKSALYKACSWTRAQCFREAFGVAEFLALTVPAILSLLSPSAVTCVSSNKSRRYSNMISFQLKEWTYPTHHK